MKTKDQSLLVATALGMLAVAAVIVYLSAASSFASVVEDGAITVCLDGSCDYDTIQAAVDAARAGDTIKVAAGTYTGVQSRPAPEGYAGGTTVTQVVHIAKSVMVKGGYTLTNWITPDLEVNLTTVDAEGQGRGLFIAQPSIGPVINPVLAGLRVTGGDARGLRGHPGYLDTDAGGGVYVFSTTATISGSQIFSNAAEWGAGLYLYRSKASLVRSTVLSHTAPRIFEGGGLYLYESPAVLRASAVLSNTAERGGGLFVRTSPARLIDNLIRSNRAEDYGGGLRLERSAATLVSNTVRGNTAQFGGGLYLTYSDATLDANVVQGNAAEEHGGGFYLHRSDPGLMNTLVLSNTAGVHGGGIHLYLRSDPVMTNTVIADNRANGSGSGLYIWNSIPRLLHSTVARNEGGDGSGVYVQGDVGAEYPAVLTNTLMISHGVGISVSAGGVLAVNGVLWDNDTPVRISQSPLATSVSVRNQHVGDPAFAPDGYHLLPDSDAINRGVKSGVGVDIDGEPRPKQSVYDLGADEAGPLVFASFAHSAPDWLGEQTVFTNTSVAAQPISYLWDFGDGMSSTVASPIHSYKAPGSYRVVLTATSGELQGVATGTVVIYTAAFTSSSPDWLGQTSFFTNTTHTAEATDYLWSFGDGATSAAESPAHAYAEPGVYTVVLTATNVAGSGVATGTVTVYSGPTVDFAAYPRQGVVPLDVLFTSIVTTTPPGDPTLNYLWRFGDEATGALSSLSHQYVAAGVYTVSLQVSNAVSSAVEIKPGFIIVEEGWSSYLPVVVRQD